MHANLICVINMQSVTNCLEIASSLAMCKRTLLFICPTSASRFSRNASVAPGVAAASLGTWPLTSGVSLPATLSHFVDSQFCNPKHIQCSPRMPLQPLLEADSVRKVWERYGEDQ